MSRKSEEIRVLQVRGRRCPPPVGRRGQFLRVRGRRPTPVRAQRPRSVRWGGSLRGRGRRRRRAPAAAGRPSLTRCGLAPGPAGGGASLLAVPGPSERPTSARRARPASGQHAPGSLCSAAARRTPSRLLGVVVFAAQRAGPGGGAAGQGIDRREGALESALPTRWPSPPRYSGMLAKAKWEGSGMKAMRKGLSFLELRL